MIRWTTPTLVLTVDKDLTGCDVWVSLQQGDAQLNIKATEIVCGATTTIQHTFTQEETAAFNTGIAVSIQVNWISASGIRKATRKRQIMINSNLLDKEVAYGDTDV